MNDPTPPTDGQPPSDPLRLPTAGSVLLLLLAVAVLYLLGGLPLHLFFGEAGIAMTQVGFLLAPALLFVVLGGYDPRATLALRRPDGRAVAGGILLLSGGTPIAWFIAWGQSFFMEVPVEMLEALRSFFITDDPLRVLWLLFLVALVPAVSEEFLFRGALLTGLRARFHGSVAVVLCGLLFGLFHLTPETAFRFLPTAWLGILLAWAVFESRSIWVGVLLHFLNNGVIVLLTVIPTTRDAVSDVEASPPFLLLLPAVLCLLWGARLLGGGGDGGGGERRSDSGGDSTAGFDGAPASGHD